MNSDILVTKNKCFWCQSDASLTCGKCGQVYYCGREHQRSHWPTHKPECRPYKVVQSETSGRYLVSTRFLSAGSLIFRESPFVIGPVASSSLVCLTCHHSITEKNFYRCQNCQWPMCSPACATDEGHRSECQVLRLDTKKCGVPQKQGETPRYDLILILRCLLLRSTDPSRWETLQSMESHAGKRKEDAEPHHTAAIRYLTEVCKVDFDVDNVHHVRGVIVTNSVNTQNSTGVTLRGLYSTVSLLNHSCHPTVTLRSDKSHTLFIRTAVDVHKGEPLLFSYVQPMEPVWARQQDLKDVYYFSCRCTRCEDPSELNTYFSSPKCSKCAEGYVVRTRQDGNSWRCTMCDHEKPFKEILQHSKDLLELINHKKINPKHLKLFLKGLTDKCHKKHFIYVEALQKALTFLKNIHSYEANILKKEIWEELLEIFVYIEPGLTRRRGISLVEFATVILKLYETENDKKKPPKAFSNECLERASKLLNEASAILSLEPPGSTEEHWKHLATEKLNKLLKIKNKET